MGADAIEEAMFKYHPLYEFLKKSGKRELSLSIEEIEKILEFKLPKSSNLASWWSNTPESGHTQAKAWVEAGYRVMWRDGVRIFKKN